MVVPLRNHFRRVDPPLCMCLWICIVEICPDLSNVYPGFDMYKGGVDPPEVGRGRYNHLTTT